MSLKSIKIESDLHARLKARRGSGSISDLIKSLESKAEAWDKWQKHCDEIEELNKEGKL